MDVPEACRLAAEAYKAALRRASTPQQPTGWRRSCVLDVNELFHPSYAAYQRRSMAVCHHSAFHTTSMRMQLP